MPWAGVGVGVGVGVGTGVTRLPVPWMGVVEVVEPDPDAGRLLLATPP